MPRPEKRRPSTDWSAVEREYRAGQVSVRAIADAYQITEGAIRKRAKAKDWKRDLSGRVREAVRTKLLDDEGTHAGTQRQRARTEREIIETHSARGASIVRDHRGVIARGRDLTLRLIDELDAATTHVGELGEMIEEATAADKTTQRRNALMRAVELPSRAGVIKDLSAAAKNWVTLERQAFNLDDGGSDGDEPATKADVRVALSKLNQAQRDHLRGIAEALAGEPAASR
jgi:hypothetical protein